MTMNVQHVNVKIYAEPAAIDLGDAIPVFHRWIQEGATGELLIDVADYRHVPAGPGVIVVGHEANYSLDWGPENRLGLLYSRKAPVDGSTADKLLQAFYAALEACRRLEDEPAFQGALRFNAGACEVIVNDRLLAPNTEETWQALKPELDEFFAGLFQHRDYAMTPSKDPRERFSVRTSASGVRDVRALLPRQ
jgi:hypothetical protein